MKKEEKKNNQREKKSILPRTAVKGLINGFIAYGICLMFIFLTLSVVVTWFVDNNKASINYDVLKYTLPAISAIILFFLMRATCRLSTFDLFKNCKIEKDEVDAVCRKMNLFYLGVVAFFVIVIIGYMMTRFYSESKQVERDLMVYKQANSIYAEEKEEELISEFENSKKDTIIQTTIMEIGLLLGVFSLIPKQKRLINVYN